MAVNHIAENVLGTIGVILWCVQIVPQIIVNWRRKDTAGLSPWLMFIWSSSSVFLGAYAIIQNINIPIILQPQLFGALSAFCWIQCLYYGGPHLSKTKASLLGLAYLTLFAGIEVAFVYAGRAAEAQGIKGFTYFLGAASAAMLIFGLFPQYWEIYRFKEVVGLSLIFMALDISGGLFCTLSLVFKEEFDIIASVNYIGIVILDGGILILAAILNPRAKRRKVAAAALDAEKGTLDSPTAAAGSPITPAPANNRGDAVAGEKEHHRDVGAISGTGRDGEPDLARMEGVVGKNQGEQHEEASGLARQKETQRS